MEVVKENMIQDIFDTHVSLIVAPDRGKLEESLYKILALAEEKGFMSIYVSSTVPGANIRAICDDKQLKKTVIIDTISRQLSGTETPKEVKDCMFCNSPEDLTSLHMQISSALNDGDNALIIIDSITTFLIYNSQNSMLRFIHSLSSLAREKSAKAVFFMMQTNKINEKFFEDLQGLTDKVFKL